MQAHKRIIGKIAAIIIILVGVSFGVSGLGLYALSDSTHDTERLNAQAWLIRLNAQMYIQAQRMLLEANRQTFDASEVSPRQNIQDATQKFEHNLDKLTRDASKDWGPVVEKIRTAYESYRPAILAVFETTDRPSALRTVQKQADVIFSLLVQLNTDLSTQSDQTANLARERYASFLKLLWGLSLLGAFLGSVVGYKIADKGLSNLSQPSFCR